jgi:SAM-dependent methyltransferase
MDLRERPQHLIARHPWETARAAFFCTVVRGAHDRGRPLRVLDVGAGDGFVASSLLEQLPAGSTIECHDANYSDDVLRQLQAEAPALTFRRQPPEGRFDLIVLLDVLEHVPDDVQFLSRFVSTLLAPDGKVLISTPAYMSLFTQHDVALGHYRRYDAAGLQALIAAAGLVAISSGGLFHSLLLPRLATKLLELAHGVRSAPAPESLGVHAATDLGRWRGGKLTTALVDAALALDTRGSRLAAELGVRVPGLSQWALASFPPAPSARASFPPAPSARASFPPAPRARARRGQTDAG